MRQQTGEDWRDVRLTLSTARPALAGSMPQLEPWFLQPWEPVPQRTRRMDAMYEAADEKAKNAAERLEGLMAPSVAPVQEAQVATALVETQGPSVTFTLPKPASIPSDWQPQKIPIGAQDFSTSFAYELTPRAVPFAFLRAKVTNTTDTLYLPGPVAVFLDGAFVATAALEQVAPGEEFDLYLGVDERVRVERRPLKERVEVALLPGLRGKMKATDYEWLTTVENFTGRTVTVAVFDQVPVSQREEITVEAVKYTPGDVEKDAEKPGVFSWKLELAPSQKQELRLAYRVRHPIEMQVQ
ncbi:MAG: hypothetical protein COV75_08475 [Candidatus Omnitrophica bacterium CG11_big_fil_rev_8_21_14_0_20_63_9]|nr:MAG: hypothetical protein COV75_08475 [Candidatus Omnitrophica bacterium CG11_big_fil_rev_8_21_14_0_20_63_9]